MGVLENKAALVTGSAQGLGKEICKRFAKEGADLFIADVKEDELVSTRDELAADSGRQIIAKTCDVTSEEDVKTVFKTALKSFDRLDIVVANAGILMAEPIEEADAEVWRKVMTVNLFGYFLTVKHAARVMKPQGYGSIIQINSKSGKKGSKKNSSYAASKFGGIGLTQSVALELAEFGVRCNAVCPGNLLNSPLWVNSLFKQYARNQGISEDEVRQKYIDQVPMKRSCEYEDVCNVVTFLASDQSGYMTGQAINVTGGQEMR